ncbi:hypothetical protein BO71DRAFT_398565 [Aspergillus ellipticus CBS 707.79]|uniref:Uncharacterized protein n=1 Tax=Aspergillus ellipticus CBS 707.79 TaxID=1448320 RepID=A0A319DBW7_9EURO|nr:hypothetical protein BO71DRAFT_398565 [Aspergillus ellipticus CBS 707.79]
MRVFKADNLNAASIISNHCSMVAFYALWGFILSRFLSWTPRASWSQLSGLTVIPSPQNGFKYQGPSKSPCGRQP